MMFKVETQRLIVILLPLEKCHLPGCLMIGLDFKRSHFIKSVFLKCGCIAESDEELVRDFWIHP